VRKLLTICVNAESLDTFRRDRVAFKSSPLSHRNSGIKVSRLLPLAGAMRVGIVEQPPRRTKTAGRYKAKSGVDVITEVWDRPVEFKLVSPTEAPKNTESGLCCFASLWSVSSAAAASVRKRATPTLRVSTANTRCFIALFSLLM
jgi:hypothetical protein